MNKMYRRLVILAAAVLLVFLPVPAGAQKMFASGAGAAAIQEVKFGRIEALSDGGGVFLRWTTSFERQNLGFEVFRSDAGRWTRISDHIVPGGFLSVDPEATYGREYTFFDAKGSFGSAYQIRSRTLAGRSFRSGTVYPQFEPDLAVIAGSGSAELRAAALSAKPVSETRTPEIPKDLLAGNGFANLPPNITNQHWIASQPGVKIGVKAEGIYRVTRSELENAGFDVNTDPALWQLFLNGNQQAIIVEPNGDYIEFYGKKIDTPASDTNIYFLLVGPDTGRRIGQTYRRSVGSTAVAGSYKESYFRRDRSIYIAPLRNGPRENFYGAIIGSGGVSINFTVDAIDYTSPKTSVKVGIHGFTAASHRTQVTINGMFLGEVTYFGQAFVNADVGVPTGILNEGVNVLQLKSVGGGSDLSLFESVGVEYRRKYNAVANQTVFPMQTMRSAVVRGFTDPAVRVFDITFPDEPRLVGNISVNNSDKSGTQFELLVPSNRAAMMIAASDSAVRSVDSITLNNPSSLSSSANAAEMVIISYKDWMPEAESWATYRQNTGVSAIAVDVEDVYDEFGFGIRGPRAIKDFVVYARANWATGPSYTLLIGDATYDPKNYTGRGFFDFVPTELFDTAYEETASDEALTDADLDGLSEVAIGRVPARNPQQVTDALNKVVTFEQSVASAPSRGSLCVSDLPDLVDFAALCSRVVDELPGTIPASAVNRGDPDAKNVMLGHMNAGKYIVNYSGHGAPSFWAVSSFFINADVDTLTNAADLSVYTMLTCQNGYFIEPDRESLSEKLFRATNGGASAVWSSSGRTTPDVQEVLATRFYNQLGNGTMDRIGDLIMDAKTAVVGGRDVRLSWSLLGDPAMKVK